MRRIDTPRGPIFLWAPAGAPRGEVIVYVHGYYTTAAQAIERHRLEEQFKRSGRRATFLVPEAPTGNGQGVAFPDLTELLLLTKLPTNAKVVVAAHSGGYRTVLPWLTHPQLRHLILLDAVYGGKAELEAWAKRPGHSLDIVGEDTAAASLALAKATSSPYTPATSHMGIITEGKLLPALLARAPRLAAGATVVKLLLAAATVWGAWRLFR